MVFLKYLPFFKLILVFLITSPILANISVKYSPAETIPLDLNFLAVENLDLELDQTNDPEDPIDARIGRPELITEDPDEPTTEDPDYTTTEDPDETPPTEATPTTTKAPPTTTKAPPTTTKAPPTTEATPSTTLSPYPPDVILDTDDDLSGWRVTCEYEDNWNALLNECGYSTDVETPSGTGFWSNCKDPSCNFDYQVGVQSQKLRQSGNYVASNIILKLFKKLNADGNGPNVDVLIKSDSGDDQTLRIPTHNGFNNINYQLNILEPNVKIEVIPKSNSGDGFVIIDRIDIQFRSFVTPPPSEETLSAGIIALIAVGSITAIALVVILILFLMNKHSRKSRKLINYRRESE